MSDPRACKNSLISLVVPGRTSNDPADERPSTTASTGQGEEARARSPRPRPPLEDRADQGVTWSAG